MSAAVEAPPIPRWTMDDVVALDPCYIREAPGKLTKLAAGRESVDLFDVLDLPISFEDKTWLLFRDRFIPPHVLRLIACAFVRETPLPDGRKVWDLLTDERSRAAVEVAERFARGSASESELTVARDAAWAAAWADARDAGGEGGDAAWAVSWDNAETAARNAAADAAWAGGKAAKARAAQINIIKRVLAEELGWSR